MMAPHPIHTPDTCPPRHILGTGSLEAPGLSLPEACIFVPINPEATPGFMPTKPKPLSRVNITMNLNPFVVRGLFFNHKNQPIRRVPLQGTLPQWPANFYHLGMDCHNPLILANILL